jgi:hypothetical protein
MAEVLFVNPNYLKRVTQLNGAVDENYISQAVILAQDKNVQIYLGSDLYDALRTKISGGTLAGNYLTLVENYVRKATAWWTMVELMPSLYVKIDNGGLVIRSSENTTAISQTDYHWELERMRQNANFYTQQMYLYLCQNSSLFPEYSTNLYNRICAQPFRYYQSGLSISGSWDRPTITPEYAYAINR